MAERSPTTWSLPPTPTTYTATYSSSPPAGCPTGQYEATYFTNMTLSGSPALTRCETTINNDWGTGIPAPGIPADLFSVRWTGNFNFAAGDATFSVTADDGVRLYLDGALVIDKWIDQSATTYTATRTMTAGTHQVKVEYYENTGDAVAKASWRAGPPPAGCPTGQYEATYFTNMTLSGSPALTRCETTINNDWGTGIPAPGIPADLFSVRWTGNFDFAAGDTTFSVTADDGVRLYLDGALVIDKWIDQSATTYTATRTMTAGTHQVKVEYYENTGDAVAKASWSGGAAPRRLPHRPVRGDLLHEHDPLRLARAHPLRDHDQQRLGHGHPRPRHPRRPLLRALDRELQLRRRGHHLLRHRRRRRAPVPGRRARDRQVDRPVGHHLHRHPHHDRRHPPGEGGVLRGRCRRGGQGELDSLIRRALRSHAFRSGPRSPIS